MHQIGMQTQPDGRVTQIGLEIGTPGARDSRVALGGVPGQARPPLRGVAVVFDNALVAARAHVLLAPRAAARNPGRGSTVKTEEILSAVTDGSLEP